MGTIVLLDLMGGVALLLWGLHMVQSGILRAFGPELRRLLVDGVAKSVGGILPQDSGLQHCSRAARRLA